MNYRFATGSRRKQKMKTEKYDDSYSNFRKREKKKEAQNNTKRLFSCLLPEVLMFAFPQNLF